MTTLPISAQTAELPGGLVLPYIEQGDPDGIPLILLHGVTDSHRCYEPIVAELPDSIRALAITQRGHGDAGKPEAGYAAEDFAGDVIAFMDSLGIERAIVAGHSLGSYVARTVAARHPERLIGLVLAGCFYSFDGPEIAELVEEFRGLGDPIDPAYARAWQESTLARPVPEAYLDMVVEETCKPPSRVWAAAMQGTIDHEPEPAGSITVPTLLVWGDRDAFIPRSHQDALLADIPGAELVVYTGGGHAMHWEQPARYAADLMRFAAAIS